MPIVNYKQLPEALLIETDEECCILFDRSDCEYQGA